MRLRRDASIAREKSINFEFYFHTWSDDRGPGPLSSAKVSNQTDQNLIFPKHFMQRDEGPSQISSDFDGKSELSSR